MSNAELHPRSRTGNRVITQQTTIDNVRTERVARDYVVKLVEYGHRASYVQRSRTIREEPYVEHTYDVVLQYQHENERRTAMRILGFFPE